MFGSSQKPPRSPGLFRMRNLIGGALALGVICGVWIADWLPNLGWGLGTGGGVGVGIGNTGIMGTPSGDDKNAEFNVGREHVDKTSGKSLRVVIEDWNYLLRRGDKETPIELDALVKEVSKVEGDADGVRLRVYRRESARATAEDKLRHALTAAKIPWDTAVYVAPEPVP
ncbi:MAG TPA: hypothetical protein VFG20_22630 [Planctomycetaceae bacterium]|nr:hypothetical protein [Planctomycetaceae bacterium]